MNKIKIHITEDEFIVSKNLERKLIALGYDVIGCSASGEDTLVDIEKNIPDLILMDIMLAGKLDGIQTANIIAEKYNIPLIFLTAYSSDEIYKRAQNSHPYAYLLKPFEDRELEINISITLNKHKLEKSLKIKREKLEALRVSQNEIISKKSDALEIKNEELYNQRLAREKLEFLIKNQDDLITRKSDALALANEELDSEIDAREKLEVVNQNQDDLITKKSDALVSINEELDSEIVARERLEVVNQNQDDLITKKSDALELINEELDSEIIARERLEVVNQSQDDLITKKSDALALINEELDSEIIARERLEVVNQNQDDLITKKSDALELINEELDSEIVAREKLEVVNQNQDDLITKKSDALVLKNEELDSEIIARERLEVLNQNQDDLITKKSDALALINKELDSEIVARERLEVVNQNQDDLITKKSDALELINEELDSEIIAREKVEQKNKILAEVIEKSGSHILITNEKAIIEYVNPEMLAFLNYTLEELNGEKPSILKPKNYPSFIYKSMWKTLLSGNVYRGDFVNVKKNGDRYNSQTVIVPFFNNKKITHYAFIGEDVTIQRENERMGLALLEAEKSRISKELHDGVGQTLTAIKFGIASLLNDKILKDNNVINTLKNQIEDSISEVREVSFVLMPSILEDYGLESALNKLIGNIESTTDQKINLAVANLKRLKPDYEVNLYRITQELLNNAIKHSACSEIKINIKINNNWISIVFNDNGVGFNMSERDLIKVNKKGGQGIFNIKNRVKALNGFIDFTSMKDVGTYVEILIPLNDE